MQAPLRRGKKETLGRANGVKRTGRSLLFGLLLVVLVTASSLAYTWERLQVERMLKQNMALEGTLELVQKRTEILSCEVASLSGIRRIESAATADLGMVTLDWEDVIVIQRFTGGAR
jgi:cell division protein FtsL